MISVLIVIGACISCYCVGYTQGNFKAWEKACNIVKESNQKPIWNEKLK